MYEVSLTFKDNREMRVTGVEGVKVTDSDYIVRGTNGGFTHFPKANVYIFTYRKAD